MRDFELQLRIRNNRLKSRRLGLGLSAPKMAVRIGVSYGVYLDLEGLKSSPLRGSGFAQRGPREWTNSALKIANFFCVLPEDLWPDAVLAVQKSTVTTTVDAEALLLSAGAAAPLELPSPSDRAEGEELSAAILESFADARLTPREEMVVRKRFGIGEKSDHTYEEIIPSMGGSLSRERVRQVELRALRKIRDACRRGSKLKDFE